MGAGLGGGLQWGQLTQPVGGEYNLEAQQIVPRRARSRRARP